MDEPVVPIRAKPEDGAYELLPSGLPKANGVAAYGQGRRTAVVVSAIAACLLSTGLVFGYSALYPRLLELGVFADLCGDGAAGQCARQRLALSGMFTVATSALNLAGMPTGALLDRCGPRVSATFFASLVATGCLLFASGGPGPWRAAYTAGFLLMAVAGPPIFVATLSFANLFPGREGLFTAAFVGCFDASSAVFIGLASLVVHGLPLNRAFQIYAAVPLAIALAAASCWPSAPVAPATAEAGSPGRGKVPSALESKPFRAQVRSAEFLLLVYSVCSCMVWLNFCIATAYEQLESLDPTAAPRLATAFAAMLPLGGIIYVPFIGVITDHLGPTKGWVVLLASVLLCSALGAAFAIRGQAGAAYAAFAVFSFCRPLFYTLSAAFTAQVFGTATFGKVYGLVFTVAGLANSCVQPLRVLAEAYGFAAANAAILVAIGPSVALPVLCALRLEGLDELQVEGRPRADSNSGEGAARAYARRSWSL